MALLREFPGINSIYIFPCNFFSGDNFVCRLRLSLLNAFNILIKKIQILFILKIKIFGVSIDTHFVSTIFCQIDSDCLAARQEIFSGGIRYHEKILR